MSAGLALNRVMTGTGTTVTVTGWANTSPWLPVTVKV